jgi:glycosyltransferase involved in cell wall biosynthesis
MPKVSVIIPAYQSALFLPQSINSVLDQSFKDFELIVVDDGSTDNTRQVLSHYSEFIQVYFQENQGPSSARNRGIQLSQGEYLAFLDADDIALPERLSTQVRFLDENPDVGIVGSCARLTDIADHDLGIMSVPTSNIDIRWTSLLLNPFIQSTLMVRRNLLINFQLAYNPKYSFAEDYELWSRVLYYTRAANLSIPYTAYRVRTDSVTVIVNQNKIENHSQISYRTIKELFPTLTIPYEQVKQLCSFMLLDPSSYGRLRRIRTPMVELYFCLWESFLRQNRDNQEIEALQKKVIAKGIRLLLFPYPSSGWLTTLIKVSKNYRRWPLWFMNSLTEAASNFHQKLKISGRRI